MKKLLECVPNFSEGRDANVIQTIVEAIKSVEGIALLDVDPGKATNRTVVTFVGEPEQVVEAAYRGIAKAAELIDMRNHQGEHPRMGATDVCPFIPIANMTMDEASHYAKILAQRVGESLQIPVFLYEHSATKPENKNLATIRSGEYEGMEAKLQTDGFVPDFGGRAFNPKSGVTAIGAREILIAYNVNLNTTSVRRANSVAFDVREQGRVVRDGDPITGKVVSDANGEPIRQAGACKGVKGIGWYIEEYGIAQVSMNITSIRETPLHAAFEACAESAYKRGMRVTGSELVGLVPLQVMLDAGAYFLEKQQRSAGVSEAELIKIAVKSMGLDELAPFDPQKKIIEYAIANPKQERLVRMDLRAFADETASESPAPGGGSIAAYVGALGASLATMVANLSAHKRGWDERWAEFSQWAVRGQALKSQLLRLVDADTAAFDAVMAAFALPKSTEAEKESRKQAIQAATKLAIETPLQTMRASMQVFEIAEAMVQIGNPNSVTDAAVGALCARTAVYGAYLNVRINLGGLSDKAWAETVRQESEQMLAEAHTREQQILNAAQAKI